MDGNEEEEEVDDDMIWILGRGQGNFHYIYNLHQPSLRYCTE